MKQVNEINLADNSVGAIVQKNGYRGDGLRAWKEDKDGNRSYFYYDGELLIASVSRSAAGEVGQPVQMMWGADGLCGVRWRDVAGKERASYFVWDVQGNLALSYNERGEMGSSAAFTAYGTPVPKADGTFAGAGFGYGGKFGYITDGETELVLCTYRFYDPSQGRWTQRDPISYEGGQNLYGYVGGDPVNRVDPSGLDFVRAKPVSSLKLLPLKPDPKVPHPAPYVKGRPNIFPQGGFTFNGPGEVQRQIQLWIKYDKGCIDVLKNHGGNGTFDYKAKNKGEFFWVNGGWHSAGAMGNYAAGFASWWACASKGGPYHVKNFGSLYEGLELILNEALGNPTPRADGFDKRSSDRLFTDSPTDTFYINLGIKRAQEAKEWGR